MTFLLPMNADLLRHPLAPAVSVEAAAGSAGAPPDDKHQVPAEEYPLGLQ